MQEKLQNISQSLKGGDTLIFKSYKHPVFIPLPWFYRFGNIPVCNYPNFTFLWNGALLMPPVCQYVSWLGSWQGSSVIAFMIGSDTPQLRLP